MECIDIKWCDYISMHTCRNVCVCVRGYIWPKYRCVPYEFNPLTRKLKGVVQGQFWHREEREDRSTLLRSCQFTVGSGSAQLPLTPHGLAPDLEAGEVLFPHGRVAKSKVFRHTAT